MMLRTCVSCFFVCVANVVVGPSFFLAVGRHWEGEKQVQKCFCGCVSDAVKVGAGGRAAATTTWGIAFFFVFFDQMTARAEQS